jgi:transcriptional regulator with XRE-family HTH domain
VTDEVKLNANLIGVIGRQVKRLRRKSGASQEAIAAKCGIYRTYLSRIECGNANPTIAVIAALANSMGVDIQEFFCESQKEDAKCVECFGINMTNCKCKDADSSKAGF